LTKININIFNYVVFGWRILVKRMWNLHRESQNYQIWRQETVQDHQGIIRFNCRSSGFRRIEIVV
jgi:hypothetical protein